MSAENYYYFFVVVVLSSFSPIFFSIFPDITKYCLYSTSPLPYIKIEIHIYALCVCVCVSHSLSFYFTTIYHCICHHTPVTVQYTAALLSEKHFKLFEITECPKTGKRESCRGVPPPHIPEASTVSPKAPAAVHRPLIAFFFFFLFKRSPSGRTASASRGRHD